MQTNCLSLGIFSKHVVVERNDSTRKDMFLNIYVSKPIREGISINPTQGKNYLIVLDQDQNVDMSMFSYDD